MKVKEWIKADKGQETAKENMENIHSKTERTHKLLWGLSQC